MAVELETLVVRLLGDGSSFMTMMRQAVGVTTKTTTQMITALNRVEGFANTLLGTFGSLGVAASLRGAFDQFAKMERGAIRLNSVITSNGGDVTALTARYKALAESLSSVTLNTKGEILSLFQMAEAQQFSGDAAENIVRNSVALAGATGQSAESMFRVSAMIQRGHPEFAKRILGLRGVADGAELVTAIEKRMAGGMATAQAEFNSASGRMERLGRSLKSVGVEIGGLIAKFLLPAVDFVQRLTEEFKKLDDSTKRVVYQVTGLTLAWLGMGPVTSVLKGLLTPVISLAYWLGITLPLTIAWTAAWVACKTVMIAFNLVMGVVNAGVAIVTGTITFMMGVLSASTALFGALLGVMALGAVVAVGAAFVAVSAAIGTAVEFGSSLLGFFNLLPGVASGPMATISGVFGEWVDIIKSVIKAVKTDMPGAMNLLKAGFNLALVQVKVLFPPIWEFIKGGFKIAFDWVSAQVETSFGNMLQRLRVEFLDLVQFVFGGTIGTALFGDMTEEITRLQGGIASNARIMAQRNLDVAEKGLRELQQKYAKHVLSAEEQAELDKARALVEMARQRIVSAAGRETPAAARAGQMMGSALAKGVKSETDKIQATIFGSAEALARISDYVDRFLNPQPGQGRAGVGRNAAQTAGGAGAAARIADVEAGAMEEIAMGPQRAVPFSPPGVATGGQQVALLSQINQGIRSIASRPTLSFVSADLGGA